MSKPGDDADVLTRALDDAEPLVREHPAWALTGIGADRDRQTPADA